MKIELNWIELEDIIKGLIEMAEEAIKTGPSIKVSVLELISERDENANEKIMHINHTMTAVCASRGWLFIDNARIKIEHLKNKGIHLNGDGMKILASDIIRLRHWKQRHQSRKTQAKAGPSLVVSTNSKQDNSDLVRKLDSENPYPFRLWPHNSWRKVKQRLG